MVVDNSCYQSIIDINSFLVKSFAGELFNVGGALHNMQSSQLELSTVLWSSPSHLLTNHNNADILGVLQLQLVLQPVNGAVEWANQH